MIGFLPSIYTQAGVSGAATGVLTALAAAVNMIGNIGSGRLLHRGARPTTLLVGGFVAMALATVLAFAGAHGEGTHPALRYVAVLAFSAIGGVIPGTLFALAVQRGAQRTHAVHHGGLDAAVVGVRPVRRATAGGVGGRRGGWLAFHVAGHRRVLADRPDAGRAHRATASALSLDRTSPLRGGWRRP